MAVILPIVPGVPFQTFGTTLDGSQYVINARWNGQDGAWFLDLLADDETPIRMGMKLVLGVLIGARSTVDALPGVFVVRDLSGEHADATLDDLGARVIVYFFGWDEIADAYDEAAA